jgi:hypothetical protein
MHYCTALLGVMARGQPAATQQVAGAGEAHTMLGFDGDNRPLTSQIANAFAGSSPGAAGGSHSTVAVSYLLNQGGMPG